MGVGKVFMRKRLVITVGLLLSVLLMGCGVKGETETVTWFHHDKMVGKDILKEDISDFYYTESNINYDAYYQRYRFYVEDGKYMFFHETRERKDDYGPCTEDDTTLTETRELTKEQWSQFYDLVNGGTVREREESAEAGDSGPWIYLYWKKDKGSIQQFTFESYAKQKQFVEFCLSFVEDETRESKDEAEILNTYEVTDPGLTEQYYEEDKLVTVVRYYEMTDGTWKTDDHTYKYRLEITGRMNNAAKDSVFVYLSNLEEIPFERASMAAGFSSNSNDYFDPKDAVLVAMK